MTLHEACRILREKIITDYEISDTDAEELFVSIWTTLIDGNVTSKTALSAIQKVANTFKI